MTQLVVRQFAGAVWNAAKVALMAVGVTALLLWEVDTLGKAPEAPDATVVLEPEPRLDAVRPARVAADTVSVAKPGASAQVGEHAQVATYLARKYRVAADATAEIVRSTYRIGKELGVDPHLILAVMAIESRMNPFAASTMGAQGLMQVIPKYHMDKFARLGGAEAVLNPVANIHVGTQILRDYMRRFGDLEAGLRAYSGATGDDFGYAAKVIAERDRLKEVAGQVRTARPARGAAPPETRRPAAAPADEADDDA
ncbi:MAG: transglycosylase SLT domain-containing protein [Burkholderiales bacterium]|nr:transglycosylase SLT domain-containing protein [Burkholderiales bacterium]